MQKNYDVLALQAEMRRLSFDPGPLDGIFGLRTARAYADVLAANPEFLDDPLVAPVRAAVAAEVPSDSAAFYGPKSFDWGWKPLPDNPEHCELFRSCGWGANIIVLSLPVVGLKRVHRRAAPAFLAWMADVGAYMARKESPDRWAITSYQTFVFRLIRGSTTTLSEHARGDAVDINPGDNPRGQVGTQPDWLVALAKAWGFVWGGDWIGKARDDMHFQWAKV